MCVLKAALLRNTITTTCHRHWKAHAIHKYRKQLYEVLGTTVKDLNIYENI